MLMTLMASVKGSKKKLLIKKKCYVIILKIQIILIGKSIIHVVLIIA